MKTILLATSLIIAAIAADEAPKADAPDNYMEEFMSGFDVGFFWRKTPEKLKETDCPGPMVDKAFQKINDQIMTPVGVLVKMFKSPMLERTWELTDFFMKDNLLLIGSVGYRYKGSAYCSGLLFGVHGGRLLVNVAQAITGGTISAWKFDDAGNP